MRGDIMFRVYGLHPGREEDCYFGTFRTASDARAEIDALLAKEMHGKNWASQYHDGGFVIREVVVDTDFAFPSRPKPRDMYCVRTSPKANRPGSWNSTTVEVLRRDATGSGLEPICEYERDHPMFQTFEPFRQGGRDFALISRHYTNAAVLDLTSGAVIAEEPESVPPGSGFCPVGFYVPDWWDVNDGSILQGSKHWSADEEWPSGMFGFIWGCTWGDDGSWKVQYLDLGRIQEGIISREERFGYLELDTSGYINACLTLDPPDPLGSAPPRFIDVSMRDGKGRITFAVPMEFDLAAGSPYEWQRLRVADME